MTAAHFTDRVAAGRLLGEEVSRHIFRRPVTVLGVARGGVPVAAEVARALGAPLDVVVVRKVTHPLDPTLALGAVTADGTFTDSGAATDAIDPRERKALIERAIDEARRIEQALRGPGPERDLTGETCLVVDDGAATGASLRAASRAATARGAAAVIAAAPVASPMAVRLLAEDASEVMVALISDRYRTVGAYYEAFEPVEVDDVLALTTAAHHEPAAP